MENDVLTVPAIPYSRDAEEAVLGAVLVNPEVVPELRGIINKPEDFYLIRNRMVWEAVCALDDLKTPIDIITVGEELERHNLLSEVGGPAYITGLVNRAPTSWGENMEAYGKILHAHGVRRRMIGAANSIANYAYNEAIAVEEVVIRSVESVQLAANGLMGGRAQEAPALASEFYDMVGERAGKEELPGIPTGFFDLDNKMGGGLQPGEFTIVAGFPGVGKTGFLDTLCIHVARTYHVGLFSLEMLNREKMNRMVAQMTGISSQRLRAGKLLEHEWPVFTNAIEEFEDLRLKMDDTAPLSMATLRARCVQWRAQGKLDVAIVDYAGLLDGIGSTEYQTHSYLSRSLKLLSQETGCHVLAAHQLNRDGRNYEKPSIFHLRGSGTWEQDANNVLLIYEPKDAVAMNGKMPRRVDIAKQRNGPTGTIDLQMEANTTKFENVAHASAFGGE